MRKTIREHASDLKESGMKCNCDLDKWEPERSSGHSHVCRIHRVAISLSQRKASRIVSPSPKPQPDISAEARKLVWAWMDRKYWQANIEDTDLAQAELEIMNAIHAAKQAVIERAIKQILMRKYVTGIDSYRRGWNACLDALKFDIRQLANDQKREGDG